MRVKFEIAKYALYPSTSEEWTGEDYELVADYHTMIRDEDDDVAHIYVELDLTPEDVEPSTYGEYVLSECGYNKVAAFVATLTNWDDWEIMNNRFDFYT